MAFQEPLEADRVDHSSLFSTIVRNPIAGVVMWALGGQHDDQEHRSNEPDEERLTDEDTCGDDDSRPQMKRVSSNISGFTHSTPSMVGSELSDIGESAEPLGSSSLRLGGSHQSLSPKLSKKHLSWSDDLGKNLVLYQNKSAARHEPPLPEVVPKKSSLSRSRSVSAGMAKNKESRFLPKGLTQRRDNASASSFKNSEAVDSNGIESPQWGWYIRTTPPTPEMYYSSRSIASQNVSLPTSSIPALHQPNPVFQALQQSNKKEAAMAWSGVAL